MSWLDRFFSKGYTQIQSAGTTLPQETAINFATGAIITDDPTNQRTNVTITALTAPTGTGFVHITGSGVDPTARAVNLASADVTGLLPITNGGIAPVGPDGYVLTALSGSAVWVAAAPSVTGTGIWYSVGGTLHSAGVTFTGDLTQGSLSGSNLPFTVTGLQGHALPSLTAGILQYSGSAWSLSTVAPAEITPGTPGYILQTNGSSVPVWVNLTGDTTIDATGITTTGKIHGATVPVAGSLTTGNGLYVSGASALSYSALNLAGGSGWITGRLPLSNLAHGTAAQFLVTNAGATDPAWVSMTQDVAITAAGAATVEGLQTVPVSATPPVNGNVLGFNGSTWLPVNNGNTYNLQQAALLQWYEGTFVGVGSGPTSICFDGASIWVANNGDSSLTKILASTGAVTNTFTGFNTPQALCFDGAYIWVGSEAGTGITKLLAATGAVVSTYTSQVGVTSSCFNGLTNTIWIVNGGTTMLGLNQSNGSTAHTVTVPAGATAVCSDSSGHVWTANSASNSVTKVTASTGAVVSSYSLGTNQPIAICFDGTNIWTANGTSSNNVTKVLASTGGVVASYTVGNNPTAIAFDGRNIWVTDYSDGTVTKLDSVTGAQIGVYNTDPGGIPDGNPMGVCWDGNNMWVSNQALNNVVRF